MTNTCPMTMPCLPLSPTCASCKARLIKEGSLVMCNDRPDLGVGEVLELLPNRRCRVAFPYAEIGTCALISDRAELRLIPTEEARGRLYLAN